MAVSLPYLASNKNVGELFNKIGSAAVPPKFTQDFLATTIGLKGTNDRSLIPFLRNLGFLDQSNSPTATYSLLKSKDRRGGAIADGIRTAYKPMFTANEEAFELTGEKLKGLIAQIAGTDDEMTARIANTFSALVRTADFKAPSIAAPKEKEQSEKDKEEESGNSDSDSDDNKNRRRGGGLRPEFQYVLQIQLPSNGTEETYLNIFNAIRKTFQ
jgi:ribosomal protein L12E/L44/L45/RPP1/RPP2